MHNEAVTHRQFKNRLYPEFARIAQALANDKRLEIIDLLSQAPRHVDSLATETGQSVANISQHLQTLKAARLLDAERRGTRVFYRLASPDVARLLLTLRSVGEQRLPEIDALVREYIPRRSGSRSVPREDAELLLNSGEAVLLDVRPESEFASGHIRGAINIPLDELAERFGEVPRDRLVITYCRGEYCQFADDAVTLLADQGYEVARLEGGWPEWREEGRQTEVASP